MTRGFAAGLPLVLSLAATACDLGTGCPTTVDDAAELSFGDEIVGGGYAIRFIPSADPLFRGYEVNVTRPVSERATMVTYFLRTAAELPGVSGGDPLLLIGARTDRAHIVVAGGCPPLTATSEEDVSWEQNQP
jgi:hypothetical protein